MAALRTITRLQDADDLSGVAADGKGWVRSGASMVWTDLATQAELDTHTALTTGAHGGIVASSDSRLSDQRVPTDGSVTDAKVAVGAAIAEAKLALASDAAAGTASRRTLGTGALQAAAGNDARLTDSRAPSGAAGGELAGTYPNPTLGVRPGTIAKPWQSGRYYFCPNFASIGTSNTLGNNTARSVPFWVPNAVTVVRIGGEITVVGQAGSKLRLGIYNDDGTGLPGTVLLDAGQIAGDSATVQEIVISQALAAGMYHAIGCVQSAGTTQPTVRTNAGNGIMPQAGLTSIPGANQQEAGRQMTGVSAGFATWVDAGSVSGTVRIFVKVQ